MGLTVCFVGAPDDTVLTVGFTVACSPVGLSDSLPLVVSIMVGAPDGAFVRKGEVVVGCPVHAGSVVTTTFGVSCSTVSLLDGTDVICQKPGVGRVVSFPVGLEVPIGRGRLGPA